jgi:hypothetical protein
MIRVILDACLIVKGNVSNVLLDLGKNGLIAIHWTPQIGSQFVKNWTKRRIQDENSRRKRAGLSRMNDTEKGKFEAEKTAKARRRLSLLEKLNPEWRIPQQFGSPTVASNLARSWKL